MGERKINHKIKGEKWWGWAKRRRGRKQGGITYDFFSSGLGRVVVRGLVVELLLLLLLGTRAPRVHLATKNTVTQRKEQRGASEAKAVARVRRGQRKAHE